MRAAGAAGISRDSTGGAPGALRDEGVAAPDDPVMQKLAPLVAAVHTFGPAHIKVDTFGKRYLHTFLALINN